MKKIKGKKISILGAHRSGLAAAKLALQKGAIPFVSDSAPFEKSMENFKYLLSLGIKFEHSGHTDEVFEADLIVTSPGVPSDSPVLMKANFLKIEVVSEIEFASWFCKGDIIAITGTNGKTTTTSLCEHLLKECGLNIKSAGNIGVAFAGMVRKIRENELVALEVSSFQLDHINKFKPMFSVILNFTPDHLNRYKNNFQHYINAKLEIYKNQDENDYLVLNADDELLKKNVVQEKVNKYYFSTKDKVERGSFFSDGKFFFVDKGIVETVATFNDFQLSGEHNVSNALAVITIAKILELPNADIARALSTFKGVEHRLEFVRTINGVNYINDSKATNVDSVWHALRSFDNPIYLILGGTDKGNDYNQIKDLVSKSVRRIYAIGSSTDKIYNFFHDFVPVEKSVKLDIALKSAKEEALKNSVVLLSPACASFDQYNSYEHRGKVFKELVEEL